MTMHILYTSHQDEFVSVDKEFKTIEEAESWLKKIKAKYYEIGI